MKLLLYSNNYYDCIITSDVIARCKKISTARSSGDTPLHKVCRTGKYVSSYIMHMVTYTYQHTSICIQNKVIDSHFNCTQANAHMQISREINCKHDKSVIHPKNSVSLLAFFHMVAWFYLVGKLSWLCCQTNIYPLPLTRIN